MMQNMTDGRRAYARSFAEDAHVPAAPADVFAVLDHHANFSEHMETPSWRTLWSSMTLGMDDAQGRAVGSRIEMHGRVLGLRLHLEERVTQRDPPRVKEWETTSPPRLLVIGPYRIRADVEPERAGARVRVRIDYDLPARHAWLGRMLGRAYARWCVREMTRVLTDRFPGATRAASPTTGSRPAAERARG